MSGPMPIFRAAHRLRLFIHRLQEQLDRIPKQLTSQRARVSTAEQALLDLQNAIRRIKLDATDKEKELKSKETQRKRYEEQLTLVTSRKEDEALRSQIAHAWTACEQLEDAILQALGEGDEKSAQLPGLEQALTTAKDEFTRFESEAKTRQADLETQMTQAKADLAACDAQIPEDFLSQYDRTVRAKGHDALAAVRDKRACTACNTQITSQTREDLLDGLFAFCRNCGRILYLPETAESNDPEEE